MFYLDMELAKIASNGIYFISDVLGLEIIEHAVFVVLNNALGACRILAILLLAVLLVKFQRVEWQHDLGDLLVLNIFKII